MQVRLTLLLLVSTLLVPLAADARVRSAIEIEPQAATPYEVAQRDGMSLNQAIESVRRRGDVERVLSAETKVEGGREVHHIKVMTKDGTVRTVRVNGRRR